MKKITLNDIVDEKKYIDELISENSNIINWSKLSDKIPLTENYLEKYEDKLDWDIILNRLIVENCYKLFEKYIEKYKDKFEFSVSSLNYNTDLILIYKEYIFNDVDNITIFRKTNSKILDYFDYNNKIKIIKNSITTHLIDFELLVELCTSYSEYVSDVLQEIIDNKISIHYLGYYFMYKNIVKNLYFDNDSYEFIFDRINKNFILNGNIKIDFPIKLIFKKFKYNEIYEYYKKRIAKRISRIKKK